MLHCCGKVLIVAQIQIILGPFENISYFEKNEASVEDIHLFCYVSCYITTFLFATYSQFE
jgi:hypothetical protein